MCALLLALRRGHLTLLLEHLLLALHGDKLTL
jgi:hypothetical protein